jgi:peptidoglycan/xylan/chitin deacetylase (PgdA/CDA1 family)
MKKIVKNLLKNCYKFYLENKISHYKGNMLIILMYHNVAPYLRNNTITPKDFEEGLLYLIKKGFRNYSLNNLIDNNFSFSDKGFIITIDDGEKDVIRYGLPILKKYNLKAILFISPKLIGKSYGFSWEKVPKSIITFEEIGKYKGYEIELMNEKDIEMWLENGLELGSHGLRHIDLSSISLDSALLEEEILMSKEILEDSFNVKVNAFCYPFGSFNNIVKDVVKKYYRCAFTVNKGVILDSESTDPYEIPRIAGGNSLGILINLSLVSGANNVWEKTKYYD